MSQLHPLPGDDSDHSFTASSSSDAETVDVEVEFDASSWRNDFRAQAARGMEVAAFLRRMHARGHTYCTECRIKLAELMAPGRARRREAGRARRTGTLRFPVSTF